MSQETGVVDVSEIKTLLKDNGMGNEGMFDIKKLKTIFSKYSNGEDKVNRETTEKIMNDFIKSK